MRVVSLGPVMIKTNALRQALLCGIVRPIAV